MTRVQGCLPQLKELNSNCIVGQSDTDDMEWMYLLFKYRANNFDCVVVIDNYEREYIINLNKACRKNKVGFILAGNLGLYGYTFVDFG